MKNIFNKSAEMTEKNFMNKNVLLALHQFETVTISKKLMFMERILLKIAGFL